MQKYISLSCAIISSLLLVACGDGGHTSADNADSNKASAASSGKKSHFKVFSQSSYPPFATRDEKGQVMGLDRDLLTAIAERESFDLTFLTHDMSGLLETLDDGTADIIATGVNITPERVEKYEFSVPYLEGKWVALVHKKNQGKIKSFADLKGSVVAAQEASLSETQLKSTDVRANYVPVKTVYLGVSQVLKDEAVAVYDVDSVLNTYLKPDGDFYTVVDEKSGVIPFGFVLKKGNTELKAKIDSGLEKIRADGTYQKILDKWYPK